MRSDCLLVPDLKQREMTLERLCPESSDKYSYAFVTANLYNFMQKDWDFMKAYEEILYYQRKLGPDYLELNHFDPDLLDLKIEDMSIFKKSRVYCSYHLGAYKHAVGYLVSQNVDLLLLIDHDFSEEEVGRMDAFVRKYQAETGMSNFFEIMNISDNSFLFTLLRALKSGKSVFIYIDANKGKQKDGSEKLARVKFFNQDLLIRKGLAYISYLSKVPVQPIITYRNEEGRIKIDFPVYITPFHLDKEAFVQELTQSMYTILEEYLKKYYAQWEWWLHIHYDLAPAKDVLEAKLEKKVKPINKEKEYFFNQQQYDLLRFSEDSYVLFDRKTYHYYAIDSDFYELLLSLDGVLSYDEILSSLEGDEVLFSDMFIREILLEAELLVV